MTVTYSDLVHWFYELSLVLSGWTLQEQIDIHQYAIQRLKQLQQKRLSKKEVD